jgi:hypothetical protein
MSLKKKIALCIGINYLGTPNQLNGCINDVLLMSAFLKNTLGYDEIIMLRDDQIDNKPTKTRILQEFIQLVKKSNECSEIWVHYSGHGSQVRDTNGDEVSGMDSVIVPCDFQKNGYILDDTIFEIIKQIKCRINLVFDCCNSGSVCDLQYSFQYNDAKKAFMRSFTTKKQRIITNPNIICISGCEDRQTSADTYSPELKLAIGALTNSLLFSIKKFNNSGSLLDVYVETVRKLKMDGYTQIPVLSASNGFPNYQFIPVLTFAIDKQLKPTEQPRSKPRNNNLVKQINLFNDMIKSAKVDIDVRIIDEPVANNDYQFVHKWTQTKTKSTIYKMKFQQ